MKALLVRLAAFTLIATVIVAAALGAFLVWGLPELVPAGSAVVIDGERFELSDLQPAHPGHWVMATMGILVAAAVIVIVVPLVIVLSVGLPLLLGGFGVALALLAVTLVMSPLILLLWWLWRDPKSKTKTTTMSA
jgi:hypothetical protein